MTEERRKAIKEELQRLEDKTGRITPEVVVDWARRYPRSALHQEFDWDLKSAAQSFWILQAREILRSVTITIKTESLGDVSVSYFVRDPEAPSGEAGYRAILKIREESEPSRMLLLSEFAAAESHLQRAKDIAAVVGHAPEADKALKGVSKQRKKIERSVTT